MRKIGNLLILVCMLLGIVLINSCKKDIVVPVVSTTAVTNITINSGTTGGNVTDGGGADVTARGVCWNTTPNPTITNSHSTDGTGGGSFVSSLTNLLPNTKYYVKAYATNSAGTGYGSEVSFTTTALAAPALTTAAISAVTLTTATSGGNITADGGAAITVKGICWAATAAPTTADSKTEDGTGSANYASDLIGLLPNTTYYVRAYATNSVGTSYGNELTFTTNAVVVPTLAATTITSFTINSAVSGGTISADGGAPVTAKGVCWSLTTGPTANTADVNKTNDGTGTAAYTSNITGLTAGTKYYVRSYAINSAGIGYGAEASFTTSPVAVPTLAATTITTFARTTASSGGTISSDGGSAVTSKGVCWSLTTGPTANPADVNKTNNGTGSAAFTSNITGLTPGTKYYVRSYAANSAGIGYGSETSFTTNPAVAPTLAATVITSFTATSAVSGGSITSDGDAAVTAKGVCWSTSHAPTAGPSDVNKTDDGTGSASFVSNIAGLSPGTTYYVRSYAANSVGIGYGQEVTLNTYAAVDVNGNGYYSVLIGTQTWLSTNLKASSYNNGDPIPTTAGAIWGDTNPNYTWPAGGVESEVATYGRLYTFYAVTDARGVCPTGFHVPTDAEWTALTDFLGGEAVAGGFLKEVGTAHWIDPNTGATNTTGFTALPAGYRNGDGQYLQMGVAGHWRTATANPPTGAWYRSMNNNLINVYRNDYGPGAGLAVRCVK